MYRAARRLLFTLPPESAHHAVFAMLRALRPMLERALPPLTAPARSLRFRLGPLTLMGPVGLAAGMDKDGALAGLWHTLGFGFAELGTVTPRPQPGNPTPRLFRVPSHEAIVNRMGFNNHGGAAMEASLRALRGRPIALGVNLGKNKDTADADAADDYRDGASRFASLADYLVINVSSPNTPGLRALQEASRLAMIVRATVDAAGRTPVFVKLSPDLADEALVDAVRTSEASGALGFVATNTTLARPGIPDVGAGGLSGAPLHARALHAVSVIRGVTEAPIIGVGGVRSPATALAMLAAGADALQLYTSFVYEGPALVTTLNRAIAEAQRAAGVHTVPELCRWLRDGARHS